jgi:filamentous hemagglutinin
LYDNAIEENKRLGFEVGSYLTEEQVKSLEKDILWYVSKFVNNSLVLVPVLYLSKSTKERIDNGTMSLISANTVNLEVGTIENRGKITGDKVQIVAEKDILNIDGKISANESLGLKAGNNLLNSSSVNKVSIDGGWTETLAGLGQISSLGTLSLDIGNLLKVEGAEINSVGNAIIKAKDMELTTLELSGKKHSIDGNTSITETWTTNYGSSLNVGGNLGLDITNNALIKGSEVNVGGSADLKVGGDLTLESAEDTYTKESITKTSSKKMSGSKSSETKETIKTTTNQG